MQKWWAMTLFDRATPNPKGYRDIAPDAVFAARADARLVDVREPSEFDGELGHVPGSVLVPLAGVVDQAASWDREAELVLICRSGGRSGRAAEALTARGFRRVMNMAGGMLAYNAAGLPADRTPGAQP